jgi:hypothetical protein
MADMTLDIRLVRLPRGRCTTCKMRRVLYLLVLYAVAGAGVGAQGIFGVARCAKCLGIGR